MPLMLLPVLRTETSSHLRISVRTEGTAEYINVDRQELSKNN